MTARILVLDTAAQTHNSYIPLALVDALARRPGVGFVRQADHGDAIDLFRREGCDTFLALGGAGCDLAVLGRLCALARRSAIWLTEDPYELAENVRVSAPFDLVFTNDLACLPAYGRNARHLPLAASLLFHDLAPVEDEDAFLYDLCFVGTAWPNRVRTVNRLLEGAGRPLRTKIALPTNAHLPPVALTDRSLSTDWRVPNPELARIVNRSRITLNLERRFSSARQDQASGSTPPPRLFENALAGGFQISLGGGTEARRYFDPRTEIAFCETEDDLIERVAWALDNPEARTAMARAARRRALAEHLYDHRADAILGALAEDAAGTVVALRPAGRKRVLLVTHNVAGQQPGGGIETYQQELADGMQAFDVYTLFPQTVDGLTTYTLITHRTGERHSYGAPQAGRLDLLHDGVQERVFEQILVENDIDLVHFQHLLGMPLSFPLIARACGVPTLYTLHDFYLVCSRFNLLDHRDRFCDIARRSPTECDVCLAAAGIPAGSQQRRRNFVREVLNALDVVVANSPYTAEYLRAIYPSVRPERVRIVEMLTPTRYHAPRAAGAGPAAHGTALRVAVPGNFTHTKGADTIIRVLCALKDDPIDFHILGVVQDPLLEQHLRALRLPRVTIRGGYETAELPRLMEGMDLSLHLSLWPETYMISLNEAWSAGAVPIVSDLGAPAERVRDAVDGFKVAPDDAGRVCDILRMLCHDRERLSAMRSAVGTRKPVSPAEHVAALSVVYEELVAQRPAPSPAVALDPRRDYRLSARACGVRTNTPVWTQEGHGWDEAPRARHDAGQAAHEPSIWRTFPTRFAHIARTDAASHRTRIQVERLAGDDCPAEGVVRAHHVFSVGGWAFVEGLGPPLDIILHVAGGGRERYAVSIPSTRKDVSRHLGEPDAEMSGFTFDLDVSELEDGRHDVRLLQVYDGVVVDVGTVAEIAVERGFAARAPAAPDASFDPYRSARIRHVAGEAEVTRIDATPSGHDGPGLVLEGWAAERAGLRVLPLVHVGFARPAAAAAWYPARRVRAPASVVGQDPLLTFAGFRATLPPGALEPGLHRIAIAETDRAESIVHGTGDAVMVLPDRVVPTCRPTDPGPGTAPRIGGARPEHRLHIEQVEFDARGSGTGPSAGDAYLYLRGWAFVPGLGRAERLTLHLSGAHGSLQAPLAAVQRPDVAEHHGAEAGWSGFEVLVPLASLPPGRYEAELLYATARSSAVLPIELGVDLAAPLAA